MDDKTLQRKLNQFVKLGNELHDEAKRRHGPTGQLFHEADGSVVIMSYDCSGSPRERQSFITMSHTKGTPSWGSGAW